ncbi:MAG: sugar ABC transporter ATP-binding protein [Devosia sp.]|nr:sugar ABC transporter ATP-binding protein [Devosia sp.]
MQLGGSAGAGRAPPALDLAGLRKSFGATQALDGASLSLAEGEILGLVGHNGAGKSTLIRIIAGAYTPDGGTMQVQGRAVVFAGPHDAYEAGIRVIHQDAPLVPAFDTIDNCYLGRPYPKRFGTIDRRAMRQAIQAVAAEIAPDLPLDRPIAELPVAERQFVRLLKAVADAGRILILDEPTAALPAEDARRFFDILRRVRDRGTAIVFVSHRLDEVTEICDRAVVLRDGRSVAELAGPDLSVPRLIAAMGGEAEGEARRHVPLPPETPVILDVRGLMTPSLRRPAYVTIRAGEVVALYGLLGSGRSSLLDALWGAEPVLAGDIVLDGKPFRPRRPADAVRAGVSYVPADRHRTGLFANFDLVFNKTLPLLEDYRRWRFAPLPHAAAERADFLTAAERVSMAFRGPGQLAGTLSGGNQQKLIFSRWANRHSKVMLLDEPTEGVDVMAKRTIKEIVRAMAADGNAVLVSTSDREEALELGDRVLVFRDGAIVDARDRGEATAAGLSAAAQAKQTRAA